MKNIIYFLLTLILVSCATSNKINSELKSKLDNIYQKDQKLRALFDNVTSESTKKEILNEYGYSDLDFKTKHWKIVAEQDSLNIKEIEKIILQFGYPGKSLVGEPSNEAAWYVIQHSNSIQKYFSLIQMAGKKSELPMHLVAKMEDRLLMSKGKEQIYGTQGSGRMIKNLTTEKDEFVTFIWPIQNPEKVNKLRKKAGFKTTVEENAKNMGIIYKAISLSEITEKIK